MFLIDDLLLKGLGISLKPFDIIWIMELMRNYALKEKYNVKKISNEIKENQLLFELGELNEGEYKEKHEALMVELEQAKEVMDKLSKDMRIQELD